MTYIKSSRKIRIAAFLIDHVIMTFLIVSIAFLVHSPNFSDENNPTKMIATMFVIMISGFILYFSKDSLRGISAGKWVMGIMVRDENKPYEIPSFRRLFLRNLFLIIWPVEFLVLVSNAEKKRLGDKVAKTVVVKNPNRQTKLLRFLAPIGVGIVFLTYTFFTIGTAMKNSDAYKVATKEIEKNTDIISKTGGIKGYGMMPEGNLSISNGQGHAQFKIKVLGKINNLNVSVYIERVTSGQWKVIEIKK